MNNIYEAMVMSGFKDDPINNVIRTTVREGEQRESKFQASKSIRKTDSLVRKRNLLN